MVKSVTVPNKKWFGDTRLKLTFPDRWEIVHCLMNGHDTPELTSAQIEAAFARPIGSPRLSVLAKGRHKVAIIFDDISRPTPVYLVLPHILAELKEAGIPDKSIRFVCALGCHGAHTYQDFQKKLGDSILDRFPVYNHNIYEHCTYVGETSQGTRLSVNSEVMACDLKIGIGTVVAHPNTGFGGGGKIILPGVSAIDSIEHYHSLESKAWEEGKADIVGLGHFAKNPLAKDFMEAANLAGLDFKIDFAVNGEAKACAIFCGKLDAEFKEAVKYAAHHYACKTVPATDIAVVNTYAKGNESVLGLLHGIALLMEKGGDFVLIMDCPSGQVVHYLQSSFGETVKGRRFQKLDFTLPWLKRMIVLCPQFEHSMADLLAIPHALWVKTWKEALDILKKDYCGAARVAIVPDGTTQYIVD
ncbi:MAG: lactate racemase domain-containing protein [Dehalococcoidia bacterium]|nr:lactate racemase domain-containing protein [Dehalococcoidia bacterium]MDD5648605.1 lactate racemase domain-containing protein [Dehalococcoidia bacterium]